MFVPFLPLELSCFRLALIGDVLAALAFIFPFVSSHSQSFKIDQKSLIFHQRQQPSQLFKKLRQMGRVGVKVSC